MMVSESSLVELETVLMHVYVILNYKNYLCNSEYADWFFENIPGLPVSHIQFSLKMPLMHYTLAFEHK